MRFQATRIPGVWILEIDPIGDERGFFARTWCSQAFERHGLNPRLVQCSLSVSRRRGTLRGMHYQLPPHAEAKLVRVTRGAAYDVALDLRPGSPTRGEWVGVELSADDRRALYLPEGCAHGFQTLQDDTELFYQMSAAYQPESAAGVRFDDPAFRIVWPVGEIIVSERDRGFELFQP